MLSLPESASRKVSTKSGGLQSRRTAKRTTRSGRRLRLLAWLVFWNCLWLSPGFAAHFQPLNPARQADIAALLPAQPAGIGPVCADRGSWQRSDVQARLKPVVANADTLLGQDLPAWNDAAYLVYAATGSRREGELMIKRRQARLYSLALAECATWQGRYLPALEQALSSIVAQPTWTVPASDPNLQNFRDHDYEVELNGAGLANDIAQILYLFGDRLPRPLRQTTLRALEARIFSPVRKTLESGGDGRNAWLTLPNNWNAVCLSGVVGAALAVLPDRQARALFVAAGERFIHFYLQSFSPDGYACEGPGYWNYGFSNFLVLRETLLAATRGRLDLLQGQTVRNAALYGFRMEMAPGNVAPFGDSHRPVVFDSFTRTYANQVFRFGHPQSLKQLPIGLASPLTVASLKLFDLASPLTPGQAADPLGLHTYFEVPGVLISRAGPGSDLAVTIKDGGNCDHSHNDVGSYAIGLGAEQPTGDPGATFYSAKTFGSQRYTIAAINSWGHPVPVVNGLLQRQAIGLVPRVLSARFTDAQDTIHLDLAPAYPVPGLRLERTLWHTRGRQATVVVEDCFGLPAPGTFEVAICAIKNWRQVAPDTLELWQDKEHLLARIEASGPYTIVSRLVNEEGLAFTRLGIRLSETTRDGSIRVHYTKAGP